MANIGVPSIEIIFKGLGVSAVQRGQKGYCCLIISDDTDKTFTFAEYKSLADLTTTETAKYTPLNLMYIKDALTGTPLKLIVARMDISGTFTDLLAKIRGRIPRNCWIGLASGNTSDQDALASWVKSEVTNNHKRYKAMVYKATSVDNQHVVNFTNQTVKWKDIRGEVTGEKFIARLLGYFAGLPLTMSGIAKAFTDLESVAAVEDLASKVNAGELYLYNDEGEVKIARAVNSLATTGEGVTDEMKFILIIEVMDMIYNDIYDTFDKFYKGKYKNSADNQALFIGAINAYFKAMALDNLLDPEFDNVAFVDIPQQRLANIPKYGEDVVNSWDDDKVKEMTYSTHVYLAGNIKILNAMEDLKFTITM